MENAEEIYHYLEEFSKRKPKTIPQELNEYLAHVARTGDPVYQWSLVKSLFKEKLLNVITDFYETSPGIEIPPYPNVDPFNYDIMKNGLLERLDSFTSAPFTVQRICELLTFPRKQYNRVDKFMRAIEKNILVVSTREPGIQRQPEPENGEPAEPIVNGSDNNSEYNVDVEMEDMSWKDNAEQQHAEPQPGSSDAHISVNDIEARLKAKEDAPMDVQEKTASVYESVTPPELNVMADDPTDAKPIEAIPPSTTDVEERKMETSSLSSNEEPKVDAEIKTESAINPHLVIPEIKVDDAEMTEQKLSEQANATANSGEIQELDKESSTEAKPEIELQPITSADENSSDSKEEVEPKLISEVSTSSEESSSSSDNTDGNSNSPKPDSQIDVQDESNQSEPNTEDTKQTENPEMPTETQAEENTTKIALESDNYSISDVNSELPQPHPEVLSEPQEPVADDKKDEISHNEENEQKEAGDLNPESKES